MPRTANSIGPLGHGGVTAQEVRAIAGPLDDHTVAEIVALAPSRAELEEAVTWSLGSDEALRARLQGLSGKVEAIYDLLAAEGELEEEDR